MDASVRHRPGAFKQTNKRHKSGRHRTKGAVDEACRGRKDVKGLTIAKHRLLSKSAQRLRMAQLRKNKRYSLIMHKRGLGLSHGSPPILVSVISLDKLYPPEELVGHLCCCDETAISTSSNNGNINCLISTRFKKRYMFCCPKKSVLDDILDYVKVSDVVAIIWPTDGDSLNESDELLMDILVCHGLPSTVHFVVEHGSSVNTKQKELSRKNLKRLLSKWSFDDSKAMFCGSDSQALNALRLLSTMRKETTNLQTTRSHMLVEKTDIIDVNDAKCTLRVHGYIRGPALNVNGLVHVQGCGDYQLRQIRILNEPLPVKERREMVDEIKEVLIPSCDQQESLQSEVIPDPMDAEQPRLEKEDFPVIPGDQKKITKKVPVGTSEYQASWIIDDSEEEESDDDSKETLSDDEAMGSNDMVEAEVSTMTESNENKSSPEEAEIGEQMSNIDEDDGDIDMTEVEKYRKERENAQFPDEIDTPLDIPARIRFQKYRGLESFRTSPWDPQENLPETYARIFKLADFRHTKKVVLSTVTFDGDESSAPNGSYVSIDIADFPLCHAEKWARGKDPLVIYGLLRHECKMSLMNIALRKHSSCTVPIVNKQKLLFYVGYRRFEAQPIFSEHANGKKFKMERFMPAEGAFVASVFAPIMFPPATVLVFRETSKGEKQLVASGRILDLNPDRIVLKRVVLSGHPFRIFRRHAVVRFMFFNRDDIDWFKPVELVTPRGRHGHILEAVGTHGHMRCRFDQQLNSMDSVMMNLYKRVYPKWTYNPDLNRFSGQTSHPGRDVEIDSSEPMQV